MVDRNFENDILPSLLCAFITSKNQHICREAIMLPCSHYACNECVKPLLNIGKIKCKLCKNINNLGDGKIESSFDLLIEKNQNELFNFLTEKYRYLLTTTKDMIHNNEIIIQNHFEFAKDEMLICIESKKTELDTAYDRFCKELDQKLEICKTNNEILHKNIKFDENYYDRELKNIEKPINVTKQTIYCYQDRIKQLQDIIDNLNAKSVIIKFQKSDFEIKQELIGSLVFESKNDHLTMKKIIDGNYQKIQTYLDFSDMLVLPNDNFLLANFNKGKLFLYDSDMNHLKTIESINSKKVNIRSLICDTNNNIFMSDIDKVIKTDLKLNLTGVYGNGDMDLVNPYGLCCYNNHIFVCDFSNRRILKLDIDLRFKTKYSLIFTPKMIKNIHNIAFLKCYNGSTIYCYDIDNFIILKQYDEHGGILGVSSTNFYEFNTENNKLFVFDSNGDFKQSIQTNGFGITTPTSWGTICVSKSKMILQFYSHEFIIII